MVRNELFDAHSSLHKGELRILLLHWNWAIENDALLYVCCMQQDFQFA